MSDYDHPSGSAYVPLKAVDWKCTPQRSSCVDFVEAKLIIEKLMAGDVERIIDADKGHEYIKVRIK